VIVGQFFVAVIEDYTEELVDRHGPFKTRYEAERRADALLEHYVEKLTRSVAVEVQDETGNPVESEWPPQ
jgi:hypothetical protein